MYDQQAKERQKLSHGRGAKKGQVDLPDLNRGQARDQVGKAFGVSGTLVDHATRVLSRGEPELVKAVDEGRMSVTSATPLAIRLARLSTGPVEEYRSTELIFFW